MYQNSNQMQIMKWKRPLTTRIMTRCLIRINKRSLKLILIYNKNKCFPMPFHENHTFSHFSYFSTLFTPFWPKGRYAMFPYGFGYFRDFPRFRILHIFALSIFCSKVRVQIRISISVNRVPNNFQQKVEALGLKLALCSHIKP